MRIQESEAVTLHRADGLSFEAIRRNYELKAEAPRQGETVFKALGEYAIHQPGEQWQFVPAAASRDEPTHWATAEELRTQADEGTFLATHMDMLDGTLFRDQRVTCESNRLTIFSEAGLHALLRRQGITTDKWDVSVGRLFNDVRNAESTVEKENMSLHSVNGSLWLSTAQTMVNVFYTAETGQRFKLRETTIIPYDEGGNELAARESHIRSSMGETGHITGRTPERPYVTARRGLQEELGLEGDDITSLVSIGSILRIKDRGHHKYPPIKAEDRTHYFEAELHPDAVRPYYTNREYGPDGKTLHAQITLEWFPQK